MIKNLIVLICSFSYVSSVYTMEHIVTDKQKKIRTMQELSSAKIIQDSNISQDEITKLAQQMYIAPNVFCDYLKKYKLLKPSESDMYTYLKNEYKTNQAEYNNLKILLINTLRRLNEKHNSDHESLQNSIEHISLMAALRPGFIHRYYDDLEDDFDCPMTNYIVGIGTIAVVGILWTLMD